MESKEIAVVGTDHDRLDEVFDVERRAFESDEEADLAVRLIQDETAEPVVSLLATIDEEAVGHVLFTRVLIEGYEASVSASLLCPLAVVPDHQGKGVGGQLVHAGIDRLGNVGTDLVFVLGHPGYYPRFGFLPGATALGFPAPYPIPERNADAWMVLPLSDRALHSIHGRVICAETLQDPMYWIE